MRLLANGQQCVIDDILDRYPNYSEYLGWLQTPRTRLSFDRLKASGLPIGVDNSCFGGFDRKMYEQTLVRLRESECMIEWLVVPDRVGDSEWTMRSFDEWYPVLTDQPLAFVLQDGQQPCLVPWEHITCVFIGGTTEWKFSAPVKRMAEMARDRGKWLHMGRVNSQTRLRYAYKLGCDSVDGSSFSKWSFRELLPALHYVNELTVERSTQRYIEWE